VVRRWLEETYNNGNQSHYNKVQTDEEDDDKENIKDVAQVHKWPSAIKSNNKGEDDYLPIDVARLQ